MNEIYKDIKGYEGLYQVSNLGNIKSLARTRKNHHNSFAKIKDKIISCDTNHNGYYRVALCKDKKYKHYFVHRLVAEAFIPNPKNKQCVNHKDFNRKNNCVNNLEWMSPKENSIYSSKNYSDAQLKITNPKSNEHHIYIRMNRNKKYIVYIRRTGLKFYKSFYSLDEAIQERNLLQKKER